MDADCAPSGYCDPASQCAPKLGQGDGCSRDTQCTSGFCNELIASCDVPQILGTACARGIGCLSGHCGEALAGGKICCNADCGGNCSGCNGAGTCVFAAAGTDPKNKCNTMSGTCNSGTCDGSGQCGILPAGAPCSSGCSFATHAMQWSMCNAMGSCVQQNDFNCPTSNCDWPGPACTCTSQWDCPFVAAYTCKSFGAGSVCVPRSPIGQACQNYFDCFSNNCMNSVCAQGVSPNGNPCTYDDECVSNVCGGGAPLVMPGHCM